MMTQYYVVGSLSLKQFLSLIAATFAVITTLLLIWFTSAATATGSEPSLAISLVEGHNIGILGAGQQRWFRMGPDFSPPTTLLDTAVTLTVTAPAAGVAPSLTLQIFEGQAGIAPGNETPKTLTQRGSQQLTPGQGKSGDQLSWQGQLSPGRSYYIALTNSSKFPLEYQLMAQQRAVTPPPAAPVKLPEPVTPVAAPQPGLTPDQAAPLFSGLSRGKIGPFSRYWYTFTAGSAEPDLFHTFKFSLFFTPDDGQRRHHVSFELYTAEEVARWRRGEIDQPTNFGAGMLLSRDGDPNTGERLWRGTMIKGDTYFLVIENGTETEIDYWLFDDDIEYPQLGSAP